MRGFRSYVILAGFGVALGLALFAPYLMHSSQADPHSGGTSPLANAQVLAGLRVSLTVTNDRVGHLAYFVAIGVEGDRTFTMPIRFIQGLRPVEISPEEAKGLLTAWIKARATGIAQFGVMSPDTGPTLLIDVNNPGVR